MVTKFMTTGEFLEWCMDYVREDIQALLDKGEFKAVVEKYYCFQFPLVAVFGAHIANGYFYNSPTDHRPENIIAPVCARLEQEVDMAIEEVYEDFSDEYYENLAVHEANWDANYNGMDEAWAQNLGD